MSILNKVKAAIALVSITALAGCAVPMKTPDTANVADNKMIIVGKFVLTPELTPDEKEDQIFITNIFAAAESQPLKENAKQSDVSWFSVIQSEWGKTFFVEAENKPLYLTAAKTILNVGDPKGSETWFPAGFEIQPKPGAKAIYVGKVTYVRDEFWTIVDVKFEDEFKAAEKEFAKKYGTEVKLEKALMKLTK